MKLTGEECKTDQETANVLNNLFAGVFEKQRGKQLDQTFQSSSTPQNFQISRELIYLLLFTSNYAVSVGEVSSSSGCLGWATLFFYCGTP